MQGGGLISEGGFGCIFYPAINKKGKEIDEEDYVTKLQVENFTSINERNIGKQIKTIRNYEVFFNPVLSSEKILIKSFKNYPLNECQILKQQNKKPNIIISKIEYLDGLIFLDYIIKNIGNRKLFIYIMDCYSHLLQALLILNNHNLVHFDLKGNNIMFFFKKNIPIIIDFGLSFSRIKLKKELNNYFYVYDPSYYTWPIEVHFINLLIHINSSPTLSDIEKLSKEYVNNNKAIQTNFSKRFINNYEKCCIQTLKRLLDISYDKKIDILLDMSHTWDNYSLSIIYLKISHWFNIKGFIENEYNKFFCEMLTQNIHPDASKRLTIKQTIETYKAFFYNREINKTENYVAIFKNLEQTAIQMEMVAMKDIREIQAPPKK